MRDITMDSTINFELECFNLPGVINDQYRHLRLGIQLGKQVVMDVPADCMVAYFPFSLKVTRDPETGASFFKGSYVQGPSDSQFIYLCWGTRGPDRAWDMDRRAKIPLYTLSWELVDRIMERSSPLRARIRMTDRSGEPLAATINPEDIEWLYA